MLVFCGFFFWKNFFFFWFSWLSAMFEKFEKFFFSPSKNIERCYWNDSMRMTSLTLTHTKSIRFSSMSFHSFFVNLMSMTLFCGVWNKLFIYFAIFKICRCYFSYRIHFVLIRFNKQTNILKKFFSFWNWLFEKKENLSFYVENEWMTSLLLNVFFQNFIHNNKSRMKSVTKIWTKSIIKSIAEFICNRKNDAKIKLQQENL